MIDGNAMAILQTETSPAPAKDDMTNSRLYRSALRKYGTATPRTTTRHGGCFFKLSSVTSTPHLAPPFHRLSDNGRAALSAEQPVTRTSKTSVAPGVPARSYCASGHT